MDVYAPTLQTYFDKDPAKWINDFLFNASDFDQVIYNVNSVFDQFISSQSGNSAQRGKFYVSFSNSSKNEITKLDNALRDEVSKIDLLRKFIKIKEMASKQDIDYLILDTSTGIRYWSINSLAIADVIFLSLKMDGIDVECTGRMVTEIYDVFTNLGTKSFLLLNRISGFCHPPPNDAVKFQTDYNNFTKLFYEQSERITRLRKELDMEIISSIPCYCDIQFDSREFLTVLRNPSHEFSLEMNKLADKIEAMKFSTEIE
jgi:MinD-like ATPase involved in chromosome partitioning or flagellar assembly